MGIIKMFKYHWTTPTVSDKLAEGLELFQAKMLKTGETAKLCNESRIFKNDVFVKKKKKVIWNFL